MNLPTLFLSMHRMRFWQPCRKLFLGKSRNFSTSCPEKVETFYICSIILVFLKMVLRTRRVPFWQPRRTFFHKRPKPFRSMSGKDFKNFSKELSLSKMFLFTRWMRFCQNFWVFVTKNRKLCAQFPKMMKKKDFFRKKWRSKNGFLDIKNAIFATRWKRVWQETKDFVLSVQERWKK